MYPEGNASLLAQPASIIDCTQSGDNCYVLTLEAQLTTAHPGQYLMIGLPRFDEKPFMIANILPLQIIVFNRGPFTELITSKKFDQLRWRGPLGSYFQLPPTKESISTLVIDSVAGLAAGLYLWKQLLALQYLPPRLFISTAIVQQLLPDFLSDYQYRVVNPEERFAVIQTALLAHSPLYIASNDLSLLAVIKKTRSEAHASIQNLFTDSYIACAMGICGRCVIDALAPGLLLCSEGPVLELSTPTATLTTLHTIAS